MPGPTDDQRPADASSDKPQKPSYYDVPMLQPPVWKWEIAGYFFLGGLSAGAYILARLAERCGGEKYSDVTRAGTVISALAALPCAPLLIKDLGDPKRFHHMLRVFKPRSPMSLGSWTLTAYSAVAALAALREWLINRNESAVAASDAVQIAKQTSGAVADVVGIPLALLLAGYTGVLLSGTATPVWSKNKWLGALFSASAMSAGAAAVSLALEVTNREESPGQKALAKIETAATVAEAITMSGYLKDAGEHAAPLTKGEYAPHFWGGAVGCGLVLPEVLRRLPARGRARHWLKIASLIFNLLGGFALRYAVTFAGHASAADPDAAREMSRPQNP